MVGSSSESIGKHLGDIVSSAGRARLGDRCVPFLKEAAALIGKCEDEGRRGSIIKECAKAVPLLASRREAKRLLKVLRKAAKKIGDKYVRKTALDAISSRESLL